MNKLHHCSALVVKRPRLTKEAGLKSPDEYIAVIENQPLCCADSYGDYIIEARGAVGT